jgi:hypothetical protein
MEGGTKKEDLCLNKKIKHGMDKCIKTNHVLQPSLIVVKQKI